MTATPADQLTTTDVLQRLHLCESSRYGWLRRAIRDGKFPPADYPQQGRGQQNHWKLATIEAWEQSRLLGSKQPALDFEALEALEALAVLGWHDVLAMIDRSSWTLKRWLKAGLFPEPDVEKLSIVQVASRFQVSTAQVRAWEKKGVVRPKRQQGVPMYGADELRQLYAVILQKEYGKEPIKVSHRFTDGYFWLPKTLAEWANTESAWGKIEQLDRTELKHRLAQRP